MKIVSIVAGALMLWMLGAAAFALFREGDKDPSLLVFMGAFWGNLVIIALATVADLAVRGVRKARRSFPSPEERTELPTP